ncbi:MAG: putative ABC exporter domain-containing protein [Myxococcaceae bacterium]|nr:putative ABC exporter domain-containing protein [Myxococcaceae bacterium]
MISALLYLKVTSLKNALLQRARRLRQPRYLLGTIAGLGYLYSVFWRRFRASTALPGSLEAPSAELLGTFATLGALGLCVIFALSWVLPEQRAGLAFTEAEIAFLFPAPLSRRRLVAYHLVSGQLRLVVLAALFGLGSNRLALFGGNGLTHAVGWWLVLTTWNLHGIGASFAITRLMDRGVSSRRRRLVAAALAAGVVGLIGWSFAQSARVPTQDEVSDLRQLAAYASAVLDGGPVRWLLLPARAVLAPLFAADTSAFLLALGPALLIVIGHFVWVLETQVSFEDRSISRTEERSARLAARRQGKGLVVATAKASPFLLRAEGRPEVAFLWKNLLSTSSLFRPRTFAVLAGLIVVGGQWLGRSPELRPLLVMVAAGAGTVVFLVLFLGPMLARQDLRDDLANADLLKTYPLRGWQVVLGALLTPLAILTGIGWLGVLAMAMTPGLTTRFGLDPSSQWAAAAGLALAVPFVCLLQLVVANAAALLFPDWASTTRNQAERSIELMGQRLIFTAGRTLIIAVAVVPALLVGGVAVLALRGLLGLPVALGVGAVAGLSLIAVELAVAIRWLGRLFEGLDVSSELRG